jgi:hypothetical protein
MNQEEQVRAQYEAMSEDERRSLFRGNGRYEAMAVAP